MFTLIFVLLQLFGVLFVPWIWIILPILIDLGAFSGWRWYGRRPGRRYYRDDEY